MSKIRKILPVALSVLSLVLVGGQFQLQRKNILQK